MPTSTPLVGYPTGVDVLIVFFFSSAYFIDSLQSEKSYEAFCRWTLPMTSPRLRKTG